MNSSKESFLSENNNNNSIVEIEKRKGYLKTNSRILSNNKKLLTPDLQKTDNLNKKETIISYRNNSVYTIKEDYLRKKKILIVDDN